MKAIESTQLSKRFGRGVWAVRDLALAVPQGAIYGFLGANGAGKTTTIRLLLGLLKPTEGYVVIHGHDVSRDRLAAARSVGALLDARSLYDQLTGRENIDVTRRLLSLPTAETDRVLDYVSMHGDAARKVGHYSLGMRQRLGLARALLGSPKVLVLDEPMNGLDPDGMGDMRQMIRELPSNTGTTVFLSSHLLAEVEQTATHVGIMSAGCLVLQGALSEVLGRVPREFSLRVKERAVALGALSRAGYAVNEQAGRLVLTLTDGDEEAAMLNHALHRAGVSVIEATQLRGSLETLYQQLRASERPPALDLGINDTMRRAA